MIYPILQWTLLRGAQYSERRFVIRNSTGNQSCIFSSYGKKQWKTRASVIVYAPLSWFLLAISPRMPVTHFVWQLGRHRWRHQFELKGSYKKCEERQRKKKSLAHIPARIMWTHFAAFPYAPSQIFGLFFLIVRNKFLKNGKKKKKKPGQKRDKKKKRIPAFRIGHFLQ